VPFISGGGGGGGSTSPAGSNTQVQFNNSGAFGASSRLLWDDAVGLTVSDTIILSSLPNGAAEILCTGTGAQLFAAAADGDALTAGGEVNVKSGGGGGSNGGDLTIEAGSDSAAGSGGNVSIQSGASTLDDGGEISIRANGAATVAGQGGQVTVSGGSGTGGGGDVIVQGGGSDGNVQLYSGDSNQYVQLDNGGLQIGATKLGFYQGAAVVQPTGVAVTAAGIHAALVSLGLITA
jgi:hypothetical protein